VASSESPGARVTTATKTQEQPSGERAPMPPLRHPVRAELIWDGKYDASGRRVSPLRVTLPFQTVETVNESAQERQRGFLFGPGREEEWRNRLIWGDKKYVLPSLLAEFAGKINLIYIDPPFDTGADFSFVATIPNHDNGQFENDTLTFTKEPSIIEHKAYRDIWGGAQTHLDAYLKWFYETVTFLAELLHETGSVYVHLDWRVVHYAKAILDEVFGPEKFKNEIIWQRTNTHNDPKCFGKIHDTILYYARKDAPFNVVYGEYDEDYVETAYRYKERNDRRYRLLPLHSTHPFSTKDDNTRRFGNKILRPPSGKYWRWSQKKIDEATAANLIVVSENDIPSYKKYLDEAKGVPAQSLWNDLKMLHRNEMVGYPTQKPEVLLERIIKASSNENDVVLDCLVGSGTTAVLAEKLSRRWIACDLSRFAIHTTRKRLLSNVNVRPFIVQNLGKYERQLWAGAQFGDNQAAAQQRAYIEFILKLAQATPLDGYTWLHGVKGGRMVHVSAVDAPVSVGDVTQIAAEFKRAIGTGKDAPKTNGVDVLGWDFAFELNEIAKQQAAAANIRMRFLRIPRDVMDKRAVEQSDIHFFELAALSVDVTTEKRNVTLKLKDFIIPPDDVPEDARRAVKHWSQWIDYWAVDWDNRSDTFHNEWQTYRTRQDTALALETKHSYSEAGDYNIVVKVIGILGNDTTKTLKVKVK
jgi:DNA modification methylase